MTEETKKDMWDISPHIKWLAVITGSVFSLALVFTLLSAIFVNSAILALVSITFMIMSVASGVYTVAELVEDMKPKKGRNW